MSEQNIIASMIIEVMGKPKEYVDEVINSIVDKLGSEKGITIREKLIHDSKKIESGDNTQSKEIKDSGFFTGFCEVEIGADEIRNLLRVVLSYMPSHLEILSPMDVKIKNFDLTNVLNEITRRLHDYDAISKSAIIKNDILQKNFQEYIKENPPKSKEKEKELKEISEETKIIKEKK